MPTPPGRLPQHGGGLFGQRDRLAQTGGGPRFGFGFRHSLLQGGLLQILKMLRQLAHLVPEPGRRAIQLHQPAFELPDDRGVTHAALP